MTKGENTKKKIFYTATKLFSEKSFSNVTMREIAKTIGIQAASIYNHYPSKESILEEIMNQYINRIMTFFEADEKKMNRTDYEPNLADIMNRYSPDEADFMRQVTRIIYMEQFSFPLAAAALIGYNNKGYTSGIEWFIKALERKGVIKNKENSFYYIQLLGRIAHSFQLDFVHPELEAEIEDLSEMYEFIYKLIINNEKNS